MDIQTKITLRGRSEYYDHPAPRLIFDCEGDGKVTVTLHTSFDTTETLQVDRDELVEALEILSPRRKEPPCSS